MFCSILAYMQYVHILVYLLFFIHGLYIFMIICLLGFLLIGIFIDVFVMNLYNIVIFFIITCYILHSVHN
jgi:hypothetical protein